MKHCTANVNVSSRIIKMKNKIWPELLGSKVFHQQQPQDHWDFSLKGNFFLKTTFCSACVLALTFYEHALCHFG